MNEQLYPQTVREMIPDVIGARILDVSQHDKLEYEAGAIARVELLLDTGSVLAFYEDGVITLRRPNGIILQLSAQADR